MRPLVASADWLIIVLVATRNASLYERAQHSRETILKFNWAPPARTKVQLADGSSIIAGRRAKAISFWICCVHEVLRKIVWVQSNRAMSMFWRCERQTSQFVDLKISHSVSSTRSLILEIVGKMINLTRDIWFKPCVRWDFQLSARFPHYLCPEGIRSESNLSVKLGATPIRRPLTPNAGFTAERTSNKITPQSRDCKIWINSGKLCRWI